MEPSDHHKVLHIASGDLWAGAEVQLYTLVKALRNKTGLELAVILLNHGTLERKLIESDIDVTVFDESRLNGLQILRQLYIFIKNTQPDIIHTHRTKENILGSIAAWLCGNIPSLRTSHGAAEHKHKWHQIPKKAIHFMDRFCGRYLQRRIIAVSQDLAGILEKQYPAKKISVIENGIDVVGINFHETIGCTDHNIQPDVFNVGIIGRLVPVKRVDIFIRIAQYMQQHYPDLNAFFHIYGDGPLRSKLEALNIESDTTNVVTFEGHTDDIVKELRRLDALLMTSDHEGLPMVLLEAMALKTPIIAHAVGGINRLLDNSHCGVLIHENEPSFYAEALYQLAKSPQKKSEITRNAYKRVNEYYSAESNARQYVNEYHKIIHKE